MNAHDKPSFTGGPNIALKVPPHQWEDTVAFYRDVLGLKIIEEADTVPPGVCFEFGASRLWIDRVETVSQAEVWLELITPDASAAARHLASAGVVRRDGIEPLPTGFRGFWIQSPAAIVHLIAEPDE